MTTRAQKNIAMNRATTVAVIGFLIAGFFGGFAYHFLLGSGFFAGLELNTSFWGGLCLVVAVPSGIASLACFVRSVNIKHQLDQNL